MNFSASPWSGLRLGIPLLETEEGTHGLMCPGGTIFPEGPALGSTWNLDLLSRVYAAIAREARAIGVHQNFTLVIEPIRDPRLGRNQEALSEDPFLCARIAAEIVRAMQGGRCFRPGQSGGRPLPLSRAKPAGERPGAGRDGGVRTPAPRGVPPALARGHPAGWSPWASWQPIPPSTACPPTPPRTS